MRRVREARAATLLEPTRRRERSSDHVLELLERGRADLARCGLRREGDFLAREGVDALALGLGGDVADLELEEIGNDELAGTLLAKLALDELAQRAEDARRLPSWRGRSSPPKRR